MINWRNPLKDAPKKDQCIAYIDLHWKRLPASVHILAGYFEEFWESDSLGVKTGFRIVSERDEHGGGGYYVRWPESESDMAETLFAWVPIEEINLPDWLSNK